MGDQRMMVKQRHIRERLVLGEPVLDSTPDNFTAVTQNNSKPLVLGFFKGPCKWCSGITPVFAGAAKLDKDTHAWATVDDRAFSLLGDSFEPQVRMLPELYYIPAGLWD